MKVEKDFKVLIDKYGFKYEYNVFSSYHGFAGPFFSYSFYNEYGCFIILHAVQRNEIEYYVSKKYSNKQEILFEELISEQVFKILSRLRKNSLNWFKGDNVLLLDYIVGEIEKKGEFFGIKVKYND